MCGEEQPDTDKHFDWLRELMTVKFIPDAKNHMPIESLEQCNFPEFQVV